MGANNHENITFITQIFFAVPLVLAMLWYIIAVIVTSRRYKKKWPLHRTFFWVTGILCASIAVIGPLAERAHMDFSSHMISHLLLGMLAPLLMVISAPMTLALRTLKVNHARRLSFLLRSRQTGILTNPIFTTLINGGGLWLIYTTDIYMLIQQNMYLILLFHGHVFIAGYLFTISIIYIDPTSHRKSFVYRSFILLIAVAGHGILSKYIYAHPPNGVTKSQSETGGLIMYYGGDAIELVLIFILCFQWYKATRPKDWLQDIVI
ncbi:cytochrome c oxidase assembly protein [Paenisporosarcina indica]|uniref:cytochrome c oxidase assembly protein n=1 Tax=Paenisporosarcina indica TaxID=650093 RepID=UPI00094F4E02|nr:cytochrome c oxidase assembly protein [Paenisporosarcina indica]